MGTLAFACVACAVGYIGYVLAYGVSVAFWDSVAWTNLTSPKGLTLGTLWAQHNESRTFFPNILAYVVINITSWNDVALMLISATLMVGALGVIISGLWREIRMAPLRWIPLPFVVLTLAQYENTLWSFQIAWPFTLFFLLASLRLLLKEELSIGRLSGAVLLGVIASYSLLQGLLIWPAGLIVLLAKGTSRRWLAIWIPAAAVCTAVYFIGFDYSASTALPASYVLHHLVPEIRGLLIATGSVIPLGAAFTSITSPLVTEAFGAFLLVCGAVTLIAWIRAGRPSGARAFCVALIVTSVLFELLLIPGRLAVSPDLGAASRYDTFSWPLLLGIYGYTAISARTDRYTTRFVRSAHSALIVVVIAEIFVASMVGIAQGQVTRTVRLTSVDVLANWRTAPLYILAPYLVPPCLTVPIYCKDLRGAAALLQHRHMNIFADPNKVKELRRLGIVPGGEPTPLLPIPPALNRQINFSDSSRHAWIVLSAVYWTDPSLQRDYAPTRSKISKILRWAIASSNEITPRSAIAAAWSPPLSAGFFLLPYSDFYRSWAPFTARAPNS